MSSKIPACTHHMYARPYMMLWFDCLMAEEDLKPSVCTEVAAS